MAKTPNPKKTKKCKTQSPFTKKAASNSGPPKTVKVGDSGPTAVASALSCALTLTLICCVNGQGPLANIPITAIVITATRKGAKYLNTLADASCNNVQP